MINRFWKTNEEFRNLDFKKVTKIEDILFEKYIENNGSSKRLYYSLKPLIPKFMQIYIRRLKARNIVDNGYESVESIYRQILTDEMKKLLKTFNFIWFWPEGYKMASVITHDVESAEGFKNVLKLAEIDEEFGVRSSFEFVPERYRIDYGILEELRNRGFEIAIHGLIHDGKLFNSEKGFRNRLSKIERYAEKWKAKGFRSPSLLRNSFWMKNLDFGWDSSFPDWDLYGPQPGGCRTVFPFFISKKTVELPVTIMQDHTLFEILKQTDIKIWKKKIDDIHSSNGLANLIVHPDYIFGDNRLKYYFEYLEWVKSKEKIWYSLPQDVATWWRRRDESEIRLDSNGKPYIEGSAVSDGLIAYAKLSNNNLVYTLQQDG